MNSIYITVKTLLLLGAPYRIKQKVYRTTASIAGIQGIGYSVITS